MQQPEGVSQLIEHLFRHESAKMVATLTRIFGIEHLNLAEDVVQEALGRALQTWPYRGIPENPSAWIMRASRNLALDVIRREKVFRGKETEIARLIEAGGSSISDYVDAEGRKGFFQFSHRVYQRTGEPCVRCRTAIRRVLVAQRSSHFCPKCQKR